MYHQKLNKLKLSFNNDSLPTDKINQVRSGTSSFHYNIYYTYIIPILIHFVKQNTIFSILFLNSILENPIIDTI